MKLNEIRDNRGATQARKRVGRGIGSGLGKTSGRGGKGQTARSGVSLNGFEGGQTPIYRRLPKRGFNNVFAREFNEINLDMLQAAIDAKRVGTDQPITVARLVESGILRRAFDGMRLLGGGKDKFNAKVTIEVAGASKSAVEAVEKAGGKVVVLQAIRESVLKDSAARKERRAQRAAKNAKPSGKPAEKPAS
jgi:large subunit ribosomal protein L15